MPDSWEANRKLIEFRLDNNDRAHGQIFEKLEEIHTSVTTLDHNQKEIRKQERWTSGKVSAVVAGSISSLIALGEFFFKILSGG